MDVHERAALRNAPAWDRWQDVRMPETVDEADAAIALVTMKRAALDRAASDDPERADGLRYAADRWTEKLAQLTWAREVLRAGESPLAAPLRELRERHAALVSLATDCPDTRTLIDTLLRRVQRANELLDERRLVRLAMQVEADEAKAKNARLREMVADRDAEIEKLRAASGTAPDAVQRERDVVMRQAETIRLLRGALGEGVDLPARVALGKDAARRQQQHKNNALALYVIDALLANGAQHTDETRGIAENLAAGLPPGFREKWREEEMPRTLNAIAVSNVARGRVAA